jgi:hypothetical protein
MIALSPHDLAWCLRLLPRNVREAMKKYGPKMVIAGGYVRSCVSHEPVNDVDVFAPSKDVAQMLAMALLPPGTKLVETVNAYTVRGLRYTLQFIHRWTFDRPELIVPSFDFTIARAAFWYELDPPTGTLENQPGHWTSLCDDDFYSDLAGKRLVYCKPVRNEDAGGSMLRVLKFYQRGFRIPLDSLGAVMARMVAAIDFGLLQGKGKDNEAGYAEILTALLIEVDPNIDPEHISHLPTLAELQKENAEIDADDARRYRHSTPEVAKELGGAS